MEQKGKTKLTKPTSPFTPQEMKVIKTLLQRCKGRRFEGIRHYLLGYMTKIVNEFFVYDSRDICKKMTETYRIIDTVISKLIDNGTIRKGFNLPRLYDLIDAESEILRIAGGIAQYKWRRVIMPKLEDFKE